MISSARTEAAWQISRRLRHRTCLRLRLPSQHPTARRHSLSSIRTLKAPQHTCGLSGFSVRSCRGRWCPSTTWAGARTTFTARTTRISPRSSAMAFLTRSRLLKPGGESTLLDQLTRPDSRRMTTESGAAFLRRQFPAELALNSVGIVAQSLGQRIQKDANGNDANLPALAGLGPAFFFPFPQFGQLRVIDSNDYSTYHGLEVQILKRMSNGIEAQFSWTWSKSLDTRSYDPSLTLYGTGTGQSATSQPFDVANRKLNYARSDFDRRHVLNSYWIWELPFGRNRRYGSSVNPIVDGVLGGWQVAGFLRYQTGRPFTVFSGANTLSSVFQSTVQCNGCSPNDGHVFTNSAGIIQYLDQATRDKFTITPAGEIGNTGRNFFTLASTFNVDFSVSKRFFVREKMNVELRADATNLTNTPVWDVPTAVRTSPTLGNLTQPLESPVPGSRKIQLGAKFNF